MRGWAPWLMGLGLVAACHEYRTDPGRAKPAPSAVASRPAPKPRMPAEWVPSDKTFNANPELAPSALAADGGAVVDGLRVDAGGGIAADIATPPLSGGSRVPREHGGGFLFWNTRGLWSAKSFAGKLEPVLALPSAPERVSYGPGYALVHFRDGARWAVSLADKKRIALPVAGLIDAMALPDGRALLLAEPDMVLASPAGKTSWRDATPEAKNPIGLVRGNDALWLEQPGGRALELERDGTLRRFDALPEELRPNHPRTPPDPRWPSSIRETPRSYAIRSGIPLDPPTALVAAAGAFLRVDLASGAITGEGTRVLTASSSCELLAIDDDVLAACRNENGTSVVVSGAGTSAPKMEKVFQGRASFFSGAEGTLAYGGPCDGAMPSPPRNVVCVRHRGTWRELGEAEGRADAGADAGANSARRVVRWIPTRDGNALGLVAGAEAGLFDAQRGTFSRFANDAHKRESGLYTTPSQVLADDYAVSDDGSLVGYLGRSSLTLHRDGAVDHAAYDFATLAHAGPFGVGVDRQGQLWQSSDFGRSWRETQGPPGSSAKRPPRPERCSRAGCSFGPWMRVGFSVTPAKPKQLADAPAPGSAVAASRPRLACTPTAPPRTRWVTRARDAEGRLTEEFDFGARKFHVSAEGSSGAATWVFESSDSSLRAATIVETELVSMTMPRYASLVTQPRVVRFWEPFGAAQVVESRFSWADVLRAGDHTGDPGSPQAEQRNAAPVLSARPGQSDGLLLVTDPDGVLVWARAGKPARMLGPDVRGMEPMAAEVRGKDELVALVENDDCSAHVVVNDAVGTRTSLELPRRGSRRPCPVNGDALATAPDGSFGVIRLPSDEPATTDDPALLLRPGQQPLALAPWSTLTPLDACPKDPAGWRGVIRVGKWLGLALPGVDQNEPADVVAVVRWSERQLCVEAVEVDAGTLSLNGEELPTRVFARFAAPALASRRGFGLGAEHEQTLSCKLEK